MIEKITSIKKQSSNNFKIQISNDSNKFGIFFIFFEIYLEFVFCYLGFKKRYSGLGFAAKYIRVL